MRRRVTFLDVFVMLMVVVGFVILMYPSMANVWNDAHQSRIIRDYSKAVEGLSFRDYTDVIQAARDYNKRLIGNSNRFMPDEADLAEYNSLLDITGTGVMGYVNIPKIDTKLAVYHGVDDVVLQVAAGHIVGSSLPVGGPGTHVAISGHRGLTSAALFTYLDKLEVGDKFYIQVLDEIMAYEIDNIDVVLPDDLELLAIESESDQCTLITCTPYGVNSHRLLVRGTRVDYMPEEQDAYANAKNSFHVNWDWVIIIGGCAILLIFVILFLRRCFRRGGKRLRV